MVFIGNNNQKLTWNILIYIIIPVVTTSNLGLAASGPLVFCARRQRLASGSLVEIVARHWTEWIIFGLDLIQRLIWHICKWVKAILVFWWIWWSSYVTIYSVIFWESVLDHSTCAHYVVLFFNKIVCFHQILINLRLWIGLTFLHHVLCGNDVFIVGHIGLVVDWAFIVRVYLIINKFVPIHDEISWLLLHILLLLLFWFSFGIFLVVIRVMQSSIVSWILTFLWLLIIHVLWHPLHVHC